MTKKDFEDFEDFNKFDVADDIVSPYEFDRPVGAGAARIKAIAVASAGFVIFGALVSGGAFAMTGTLPNVLPSAPAVVAVVPSAAPSDSATPAPSDIATATDGLVSTDTPAATDTPIATDTATPTDTPATTASLPAFSSDDDESDDQSDDDADDQGFEDEGSDD